MKFRPILFSTEMVQAILAGNKTQTRRTKGLEKINNHYFQSLVHHATGRFTFVKNDNYNPTSEDVIECVCPYSVGEVLRIIEKKGSSNIYLKIKSIRVERLFHISKVDAIAEGIEFQIEDNIKEYRNYMAESKEFSRWNDYSFPDIPELSFISLWEKRHGKETLELDPWVWVIEFERIDQ